APEPAEPARGEWFDRSVEPDADLGQDPEGGEMRDVPLRVAKRCPGDREPSHGRDRHRERREPVDQGGSRDQVRRGGHQRDVRGERAEAREPYQQQPPTDGGRQPHEPAERARRHGRPPNTIGVTRPSGASDGTERWSPTTRPARSETTRSAAATGSGRCAITGTVRPCVSRERASSTSDALSRSRCDVGSSRIRSGASLRKARASARRWRSPPLSRAPPSPMSVAYPSGRFATNRWALAALAAATSSSCEASGRARRRFSATLPWNSDACCGTHATRVRQSAGSSSDSGWPPTVTHPRSGSTNRRRTFATVVLPAPVGPTTATVRPCGISSEHPARAVREPSSYVTT